MAWPPSEFDIGNSFALRQESFSVRDRLFAFTVLAVEAFHASGRVNQLLFAGEERMAFGANLQTNLATLGGTRLEFFTARANNIHFNVFGVNFLFHEPVLN
jgi:hypothetical protein